MWLLLGPLTAEPLIVVHGFRGVIAERFQDLIRVYERESGDKVTLMEGGDYRKVAQNADVYGLADILHLSEFAAPTEIEKLRNGKAYVAVSDLLPELRNQEFLGCLHIHYGGLKILYALPFNPSMGIVFYKKDVLCKAGVKLPLKTWEAILVASEKLKSKGYVGFTFPWTAAYTYEFFVTLHNYYLATAENGFTGAATVCLDKIPELVNFFAMIFEAGRKGYFHQESDVSDIVEKYFVDNPCAMLMQGAARREGIQKLAATTGKTLKLAYGPLPYVGRLTQNPWTPKIGGGAFWVTSIGAPKLGVKRFLRFMTRTDVQADWALKSGYLPVTVAAHKILVGQGYYRKHPEAKVAIDQVLGRKCGRVTHLRLPSYDKMRSDVFNPLFVRYLKEAQADCALDLQAHAKAFLQEFTRQANEALGS